MKEIPQRDLRNQRGEILRETEKGESFLITVGRRPIALLTPYPKKQWVPRTEAMKLLGIARPDPRFFEDVAELGGMDDLEDPWQR